MRVLGAALCAVLVVGCSSDDDGDENENENQNGNGSSALCGNGVLDASLRGSPREACLAARTVRWT